jgi:formyl-CoA transferase
MMRSQFRQEWGYDPIPALLPPGAACDPTPRMDAIPALGQHADMILAELGWSAADIAVLRSAGAI